MKIERYSCKPQYVIDSRHLIFTRLGDFQFEIVIFALISGGLASSNCTEADQAYSLFCRCF